MSKIATNSSKIGPRTIRNYSPGFILGIGTPSTEVSITVYTARGILLHADRFKHINNVARIMLHETGLGLKVLHSMENRMHVWYTVADNVKESALIINE